MEFNFRSKTDLFNTQYKTDNIATISCLKRMINSKNVAYDFFSSFFSKEFLTVIQMIGNRGMKFVHIKRMGETIKKDL